jgi:iron(III) transport system permease protein
MQNETALTRPADLPKARNHRQMRAPLALSLIAGLVAAAMLLPLIYLLLRAWDVGLVRAADTLLRLRMLEVMWNSVLLAGLVTGISLLLALPLAWLLVRTDLPHNRFWTVTTTLPLVIPSYVGAFTLVAMMGPRGIMQGWLEPLGVERLPSLYGLFGATWALTLFTYPYLLLSIRAGLSNLDPALEEVARSLGYGPWRTFWHATLPALRPAIASGALLVALYVLSDFGAVSLLRYPSFTRVIYVQYQSSFDRSTAALLSLLLVMLTLLLLYAAQRIQGRRRYHRTGVGVARRQRTVRLRGWTVPAQLFCSLVTLSALVMPLLVIGYWLIRGLLNDVSLQPLLEATWNSLHVSVLAAVVAVVLALPVAFLSVRFPSRFSYMVSRLAYIGFGLPGIVVALSLIYFGANYVPLLYQTLFMLLFAYTVRFLPEALGTLRTNLFQISPRMEEAGRSLGLTQPQVMRRVTAPLLRPGLWAGAALVFLSTIRELPATLLLGPTGFTTLATEIWAATEQASFAQAAAPSLLLLTVSALSLVFVLQREGAAE